MFLVIVYRHDGDREYVGPFRTWQHANDYRNGRVPNAAFLLPANVRTEIEGPVTRPGEYNYHQPVR